MVRELLVSIQGLQLCLLVILFPVAGADLILGAAWLGSIGPMYIITLLGISNSLMVVKNIRFKAKFHPHHTLLRFIT